LGKIEACDNIIRMDRTHIDLGEDENNGDKGNPGNSTNGNWEGELSQMERAPNKLLRV
jgi:hypothetical protein